MYCNKSIEEIEKELATNINGLTEKDAIERLKNMALTHYQKKKKIVY